jgi:hypothetical protein
LNRRLFLAILSGAALVLSGCASPSYEYPAVSTSEGPPTPLAEAVPPAPYADAYWIPGHWKSDGRRYVWANGRWEHARPGMVYQQAYWSNSDGRWVYRPGLWVSADAPLVGDAPQIVQEAPPSPRVEVMTAAPDPTAVWITGYWQWHRGRYAWTPGRWEHARPGHFWAPGHWVRFGSGWRFSGGFWQRF